MSSPAFGWIYDCSLTKFFSSAKFLFGSLKGRVEKTVIEGLDFVGTGLVLQDESFRMNPCPNSKEDSHTSC